LVNDGVDGEPFITLKDVPEVLNYTLSPLSDNKVNLLKGDVVVSTLDLSSYLDNTTVVSGEVKEGKAVFTKTNGDTFEVDFTSLIDVQPTKTSELVNDGVDGEPFITLKDIPESEGCFHFDGQTLKMCNLQTKLNDKLLYGRWNANFEEVFERPVIFIKIPHLRVSNIRGKLSLGMLKIADLDAFTYSDFPPRELTFNVSVFDKDEWEEYAWKSVVNDTLDFITTSTVTNNENLQAWGFYSQVSNDTEVYNDPEYLLEELDEYYLETEEPIEIKFGSIEDNGENVEGIFIYLSRDVRVDNLQSVFASLDELEITFLNTDDLNTTLYKNVDYISFFTSEEVKDLISYEGKDNEQGFSEGDFQIPVEFPSEIIGQTETGSREIY